MIRKYQIACLIGIVIIVFGITGYQIGYANAQKDIMNDIIVSNTEKEKGFYTVEYDGTTYLYWYE